MLTVKDFVKAFEERDLIDINSIKEEDLDLQVKKISYNSQDVDEGTLFFCKGEFFKDEYLKMALEKGAIGFVYGEEYTPKDDYASSFISVKDTRLALAVSANLFYEKVWKKMNMIGVTGTKGKTTTVYYLKSILEHAFAKKIGFLTTVDYFDGVNQEGAILTTPETFELHHMFSKMVENGVDTCLMEVSSQALKYHRTAEILYDYGAFSNISNDHISEREHPDFEDYFSSKLMLMSQCKKAVVNLDIERSLRDRILEKAPDAITYGMKEGDYTAKNVTSNLDGVSFTLVSPKGEIHVHMPMIGEFNISNALCASAIALDMGAGLEDVKEGLKNIFVPGRMNVKYDKERDVFGIVDFAHNKVSMEALIDTIVELKPGAKYTFVYGCRGGKAVNRKRECTEVAQTIAHRIILTENDPGPEDNLAILNELKSYITNEDIEVVIIEDREEAIHYAFETAEPGEVVMVTGKGADTVQKRGTKYFKVKTDVQIMDECF